jgi:Ca2+-transporting ATPase
MRLLLEQFTDFMIVVLLAAAVISGVIGDLTDTVVILVIVVLNAVIGFVQAYRAERAIAALKALAAPTAHVLRDGQIANLAARELVPGDMVVLEAGNAVPADLRLIEAVQLKVEEAALTGESHAVEKQVHALAQPDLPLGDRRNMAYKGTLVAHGRGRGLVVATGMSTELGRIAKLLSAEDEVRTPLQKRLAQFGRVLSLAVLGICALLFVVGVLRGEPLILMALTSISLAVAAIPRGAARGGHGGAGIGGAPAGGEERPDPQAACGGDPRLGDLYLLGQDRHAHGQPHARGGAVGAEREAGAGGGAAREALGDAARGARAQQ